MIRSRATPERYFETSAVDPTPMKTGPGNLEEAVTRMVAPALDKAHLSHLATSCPLLLGAVSAKLLLPTVWLDVMKSPEGAL